MSLSTSLYIIISDKTSLFVSTVAGPLKHIIVRLHAVGIPHINMVGYHKYIQKYLNTSVDIRCVQGGESSGHTGEVPTSILISEVVGLYKWKPSPFINKKKFAS